VQKRACNFASFLNHKNEKMEKNMNHCHLFLVEKFVSGDGFLLSHLKWNFDKIPKYVKPINSNAYG